MQRKYKLKLQIPKLRHRRRRQLLFRLCRTRRVHPPLLQRRIRQRARRHYRALDGHSFNLSAPFWHEKEVRLSQKPVPKRPQKLPIIPNRTSTNRQREKFPRRDPHTRQTLHQTHGSTNLRTQYQHPNQRHGFYRPFLTFRIFADSKSQFDSCTEP